MSSTFRGAVRNAADFYPTPLSAFEPLLPYLPKWNTPIWEPACGDRRLIASMRNAGLRADGSDLTEGNDYLKRFDLDQCIVTNPPYSLAFEFVQHAVKYSEDVFMLLRLNFLASQKRKAWFVDHEPRALFVLTKRPSFTNGGTDSTDYAWFHWSKEPVYRGVFHL